MATGGNIQLTKMIGEYLVYAELCRRGLLATTFTENVPEFEILATDKCLQYETQSELDALMPSTLARAFRRKFCEFTISYTTWISPQYCV